MCSLTGGAVLLCEKALNDDGAGPFWATQLDLMMMTSGGGKERTFRQYEQLLLDAGFTGCEIKVLEDVPLSDAIIAYKK